MSYFISKLFTVAVFTFSFLDACLATSIPPPTGSYGVGRKAYVVPFVNQDNVAWPGNISTSYLATLYYPTLRGHNKQFTPYTNSDAAAAMAEVLQLSADILKNLTSNIQPNASIVKDSPGSLFPSLVFQPGLGASSEMYTITLVELASQGYAVIALDFPYDGVYVRYPDGTSFPGSFNSSSVGVTIETLDNLYNARVHAGLHFTQFWPTLVEQLDAPFQTSPLGVLGHSFGGAASLGVAAATPDTNLVASALNLDGPVWGKLATDPSVADLKRPVVMLGETVILSIPYANWTEFTQAQTGWWRGLYVDGADHYDFSDISFWRNFAEIPGPPNPINHTIEGTRMANITGHFVAAFFNQTLRNQEEKELSQPGPDWPEVSVFGAGNVDSSS